MPQKPNATCDICGREYHICRTCQEVRSFTPWRSVADTFPHYMIFLALSEYTRTKDKRRAREELSKCDLSDSDTYRDIIKAAINEIMTEEKKGRTTRTGKRKGTPKTERSSHEEH